MQQCPFCGTQWSGSGPCPSCGLEPETSRDDAMFRPPENDPKAPQEAPPEFEVEKLLRWEPSPEADASPEATQEQEEEDASLKDSAEEEEKPLKSPLKRWQKLTMAAVAVVVVAALVVRLWPQTPSLPPVPAFFVQNNTLMALPMGDKPQKLAAYNQGIEDSVKISPDHQKIAWVENGILNMMLPEEEVVSFSKTPAYYPQFSQDGRFLYCMVQEDEENILYQMDVSSRQERRVGPVGYYSYWEDRSLLVLQEDSRFAIYDVDTLKEIGSLEIEGTIVSLSGNRVYYVENMAGAEGKMRLCCWQDGETMVVLENIISYFNNGDGPAYIQCNENAVDSVSIAELVNNDLGTEGNNFLKSLEQQTITPPQSGSVYYFTGDALRPLGEGLTLSLFPEQKEKTVLISSPGYASVEEAKGAFSLKELYELVSSAPEIYLQGYILDHWPKKDSKNFVAVEEKLYRMPEDAPKDLYQFRLAGDYVCLYQKGQESSLWVGRLQGENVEYQASYLIPEMWITDFTVTQQGEVYYWEGEYTTTLYKNGVQISPKVAPGSIQCTQDGAVYFLEGASSQNLTLCRVYGEEREELAQKVMDFFPYTRDYVVCLQLREDGQGSDLLACTAGEEPVVAAEQVERLFLPFTESSLMSGEWQ